MLNNRVYRYLIKFLIGKHAHLDKSKTNSVENPRDLIRYTNKAEEMKRAGIVIYRSNFFSSDIYGTEHSEPKLPLQEWRGIPILFGENREEWINDGKTLVIYADLVASAFYLLSRYEEILHRGLRDEHGRFPAEKSLPVRAGFIHRPIVDEYSEALRQIVREHNFEQIFGIRLEAPKTAFAQVNLSHDLDQPYRYNGWRSFFRAFLREQHNPLKAFQLAFLNQEGDEFNTFSDLLCENGELIDKLPKGLAQTVFFLKTPSPHILDRPNYNLSSPYMRKIMDLAEAYNVKIGLHASYHTGLDPRFAAKQKKVLDKYFKKNIVISRHHYLAQREPEDLKILFDAGIKHDYSMGYVGVAGFRLGTCRPVKYINPNTRSLWELTMHPLTMMDVTLSRPDCMNLSFEEAEQYAHALVRQVARHKGELNLLWHNEQFAPKVHPWQGKLYTSVLKLIRQLATQETNSEAQ